MYWRLSDQQLGLETTNQIRCEKKTESGLLWAIGAVDFSALFF